MLHSNLNTRFKKKNKHQLKIYTATNSKRIEPKYGNKNVLLFISKLYVEFDKHKTKKTEQKTNENYHCENQNICN